MSHDDPSLAMRRFLRDSEAGGNANAAIPASEEELRFEAAWKDVLAKRRHASQVSAPPQPFDLASIKINPADQLTGISRPHTPKSILPWFAFAAAVAVVLTIAIAYRRSGQEVAKIEAIPDRKQPGAVPSPESPAVVQKPRDPRPESKPAAAEDELTRQVAAIKRQMKELDGARTVDELRERMLALSDSYEKFKAKFPNHKIDGIEDAVHEDMIALPANRKTILPESVDSLAALTDELKNIREAKLPKDDPAVRDLRKKILAYREANGESKEAGWSKLVGFLADYALPEDRLADMKPKIAALLSRTPADVPILLRTPEERAIYDLAQKSLASGKEFDAQVTAFVMRGRISGQGMGLLVPAYTTSQAEWSKLVAAHKAGLNVIAVVNLPALNQGVSNQHDGIINEAIANGLTVIAYVDCMRGGKPPDVIIAECKERLDEYPRLQGFFLDLHPTGGEHVAAFKTVYAQIHAAGRIAVACPGSNLTVEDYMTGPTPNANPDIICNMHTADPRGQVLQPPSWAAKYPPERFAAILYGLRNLADLPAFIESVAAKHMSWVYVATDGSYASLPPPELWKAEMDELLSFNGKLGPSSGPRVGRTKTAPSTKKNRRPPR